MAKVFKRKWNNSKGQQSCWALTYSDTFGKRKIESGFETKVEAEKELSKRLQEVENGSYCDMSKTLTFSQLADKFMKYHAKIHLKESTYDHYADYLRVHILPILGEMKFLDIMPNTINEYILLKQNTTKLSNSSINKHIALIKVIFNNALDSGVINRNPAARVKKLKEPKKEQECFTFKEVLAVLEVAKRHYADFHPLLYTAIFTGMRQGELIGLTWDKINFVENYIKVDKSVYKNGFCTTKSFTSNRKINMVDDLRIILKEWRLRCPHSELNLVFPNEEGNFLDRHNLRKRTFKAIIRRAGVKEIRFHDLRHTFASISILNGAEPQYVQDQMGHSSVNITMDVYSHLMPESHQKGVNVLNNLLKAHAEEIKKFGT